MSFVIFLDACAATELILGALLLQTDHVEDLRRVVAAALAFDVLDLGSRLHFTKIINYFDLLPIL
jgi:hypothetical protein